MAARCLLLAVSVMAALLTTVASEGSGENPEPCNVTFGQSSYSVSEEGTVEITVTIIPPGNLVDSNVTISLTASGGTASSSDYQLSTMSLDFSNATRVNTFTVTAEVDDIIERNENFEISLVNADMMGSTISLGSPTTVTITDTSTATVSFNQSSYDVIEGEKAVIEVILSPAATLERDVILTVTPMDDTAIASDDFSGTPQTLTLTSGTTSGTACIQTMTDSTVEEDEIFKLSLTVDDAELSVSVENGLATVTITDTSTATVSFNQSSYDVIEGEKVVIEVILSPAATLERIVILTVTPMNDTAIASDDFSGTPQTLTLTPGTTSGTACIQTETDLTVEVDEMFQLSLAVDDAELSVTVENGSATVNIIENTAVVIEFDQSSYTLEEGEVMTTNVSISVQLEIDVMAVLNVPSPLAITPYELMFSNTTSSVMVMIEAMVDDEVGPMDQETVDITLNMTTTMPDVTSQITLSQVSVTVIDATIDLMVSPEEPAERVVEEGNSITLNLSTTTSLANDVTVVLTSDPTQGVTIDPSELVINSSNTTFPVVVTVTEDDDVMNEIVQITISPKIDDNVNFEPVTVALTVIDRTIRHEEGPESQGVEIDNTVTLTCQFISAIDTSIIWTRDETVVLVDANPEVGDANGTTTYTSTLMIVPVNFTNCGNYTCTMRDVSSSTAEIGVFEYNGTSPLYQTSSIGAIGTLFCAINYCGAFSIDWIITNDSKSNLSIFNEATVATDPTVTSLNSTATMLLGGINQGMSQSCRVLFDGELLNATGFNYNLLEVEVNISVVAEDNRTVIQPSSGSFIEGDRVVLNCTAINPPDVTEEITITWTKRKEVLEPDKDPYYYNITQDNTFGIELDEGDGYLAMIFPSIHDNSSHEGTYACTADNRLGKDDEVTENFVVEVRSGPVVIFPVEPNMGFPDIRAIAGENTTITCSTEGSNPPATSIAIRILGEELNLTETTTETSVITTIINSTLDQDGKVVYQCRAVNNLGDTVVNATLRVIAVPEPVGDIITKLLNLHVTEITWTAPEYNNAPIIRYEITICWNGCRDFNTSETELLVELDINTTYDFNITAVNAAGRSIATMRNITGATDGAMPIDLQHQFYTRDIVQLNWDLNPLVNNISGFKTISVLRFDVKRNDDPEIKIENSVFVDKLPLDLTGTTGTILYTVTVVYSDPDINRLNATVYFEVVRPTIDPEIDEINKKPATGTRDIDSGDGSLFGFIVAWSPPAGIDPVVLVEYTITIARGEGTAVSPSGRKRRALPSSSTPMTFCVPSTDTSYNFNSTANEDAFTNFTVGVVGLVQVGDGSGDNVGVTALADTLFTTAEGRPSMPRSFMNTSFFINSVVLSWEPPEFPRGVLREYIVTVDGRNGVTTTGTTVEIKSPPLIANTDYTVRVEAMNGILRSEAVTTSFTTSFGVVQPSIVGEVGTNEVEGLYFLRYSLSDMSGPISYIEIYAVISDPDEVPDTTRITGTVDDRTYVTSARNIDTLPSGDTFINIGTGTGEDQQLDLQDDVTVVKYNNRPIRRGANYFFFIRAYSSVDTAVHNTSQPMSPIQLLPGDEGADPTIVIIAVILGILAAVLILVLVILILFAFRGRLFSASYKVPHLRRLEDGEKGGIELRRRTRHFTPVLDVGDPNAFTSAGQPTTLVCEVSGTPAPTVKWSRSGKPVDDDERFLILADHSLFIQNTSIEDEGSYVVTAENATGNTGAEIKLTVIKPTPPEPDEAHGPVQVDQFPEYYARITANDGDDLDEEYQDVEPDCPNTAYAAKLSINRNKNRYINIIPYDHSRVVLALQENTPGSDYVNASFINGYKRTDQYIATQGPTTTTLADFWRMVWEFDSPTIVMVTKLEEEDKKKCEQYWPSYGSTTYGNIQVTLKEAENLAEYSIRTFTISPLAGQSSAQMPVREVKQFHFLKWPDHGVPNYATALLHFRKRVHNYHPMQRGPMVVHCSAGVGRTGTFITVDYNMERMEGEGSVDIFNFVQQMRFKRNYMVQTSSQYEFIHEAINEAITCGDTSIKAPELKDWLSKLTSDPDAENKNILEEQFKRLETASPHDDEFDCTVADVNTDKNRITKHLPANEQRVVLSSDDDQPDYICASYVDGYRQRNAFMITQGPMEDTIGDFWRMVWEQKSAAIVILTQLEENGEEMSKKYWSDTVGEAAVFGKFNVELTSEVRDLGDYCTRKIKLSPISKPQESRIVTQFHFTKWTVTTPPESAKSMIDMIDELQRVQRKSGNQPITVHCNNGLGRTGTFCALYYVLDRVKTEQVVDVFQAVKTLRIQRTGLVDNVEQYKFIHTATVEFLNTFSDYQNFK